MSSEGLKLTHTCNITNITKSRYGYKVNNRVQISDDGVVTVRSEIISNIVVDDYIIETKEKNKVYVNFKYNLFRFVLKGKAKFSYRDDIEVHVINDENNNYKCYYGDQEDELTVFKVLEDKERESRFFFNYNTIKFDDSNLFTQDNINIVLDKFFKEKNVTRIETSDGKPTFSYV